MRWLGFLLVVGVVLGLVACEDEESEITGTYQANVFESMDTCDNSRDSYGLEIEITRQGSEFRVLVNDAGPLTGGLEEGILVVTGTVTGGDPPCDATGACPRDVRLEMDIRRGRIVEGKGRVTWNGTFPGVSGVCVQEFDFTGFRRDARVPVVG